METGHTLWSWETPASNYSPVLATAGGILFNGSMDRYLRAFDQSDGKVLWQTRLGSQVFGAPVIVQRERQAIYRRGGRRRLQRRQSPQLFPELDQPSGCNMVYVFALPE